MSNCKTIGATSSRLVTFASVVCLLGTAQAPASDMANAQHSVTVNYRDLNLSTLKGATTLYRRITGAARLACGDQGYGLFEQRRWKSCVQSAIAGAVATVNNPLLRTVHSRENPQTDVTAMLAR
jgi:UrcA family protein